jgi:hypothetical protein
VAVPRAHAARGVTVRHDDVSRYRLVYPRVTLVEDHKEEVEAAIEEQEEVKAGQRFEYQKRNKSITAPTHNCS